MCYTSLIRVCCVQFYRQLYLKQKLLSLLLPLSLLGLYLIRKERVLGVLININKQPVFPFVSLHRIFYIFIHRCQRLCKYPGIKIATDGVQSILQENSYWLPNHIMEEASDFFRAVTSYMQYILYRRIVTW